MKNYLTTGLGICLISLAAFSIFKGQENTTVAIMGVLTGLVAIFSKDFNK